MSEGPTAAAGTARRVGSGWGRLARAWRVLPHESRLAAFASLALFLTLFLPWYQRHFFVVVGGQPQPAADTQTGWAAFSFVEAAILLVAAAVLVLLYERAEGRAFHLPGGDGGVISAAGLWTCVLVVWRIFDKQGVTSHGEFVTSYGIEWGIFVALAAAGFLGYSGSRIRAAHRPEPPLPGESASPVGSNAAADATTQPRRREPRAGAAAAEPRAGAAAAEPRRRAPRPAVAERPRRPVSGERPRRPESGERPRRPDSTDRPRHRVLASELFERVVPEDPPVMRFGRIPPSQRPSIRPETEPTEPTVPTSSDRQLTIPLHDDTVPLGEDDTLRLGEDDTVRIHRRPEP